MVKNPDDFQVKIRKAPRRKEIEPAPGEVTVAEEVEIEELLLNSRSVLKAVDGLIRAWLVQIANPQSAPKATAEVEELIGGLEQRIAKLWKLWAITEIASEII